MKGQPIVVITVKALCLFGCYDGMVGTALNVLPEFNSHTHLLRFRSKYHPNLYSFPRAAVKSTSN